MTGPWLSTASGSRSSPLSCDRFCIASYNIKSSGVISIERATAISNRSPNHFGKTCSCTENDNSTKPNSPACANERLNSHRLRPLILKTSVMKNNTPAFMAITPTVMARNKRGSFKNPETFIPAPTVIKNRPSNSPLNGSMSLSNSCRNSELAKTTPAKKVPKAGERPTSVIKNPIPATINRARAVYISRKCAAWI